MFRTFTVISPFLAPPSSLIKMRRPFKYSDHHHATLELDTVRNRLTERTHFIGKVTAAVTTLSLISVSRGNKVG